MNKKHPLKVPRRYRLSFFNESSLNRVWTIGMSHRRMILYIIGAVIAVMFIGASLIAFTPIKVILPGYLNDDQRRQYIEASERLDSIIARTQVTDAYLANLVNIVEEDINVDSLYTTIEPSSLSIESEMSLKPTSAEEAYVREYLEQSGFDLNASVLDEEGLPEFRPPVDNAIVSRGSTPQATRIRLQQTSNPVFAIASGTIVAITGNTPGSISIVLQHPNGYLSRYNGLERAYLTEGKKVEKGTRLGIVKSNNNKSSNFDFSLWLDGRRLQPLDYIPF